MSGETALARQLKKLAVPQTTLLIQDKIRKSFLFDHRDAAGLDREVIFTNAIKGFQELCDVEPLFSKFGANLFSISYKDFERSVQSANVNQKLDEKISEFLRMLSPHFLRREGHLALEWLICRFHIHLYNIDELIASALPYCETPYFVRVVQLLDLDESSRWFWLKQIQKTGVHLDYSAVSNRFLVDAGFRKLVCDIAPNVLSVYKNHQVIAAPVVSFSMLSIKNALYKCKQIDNKLVTFLFPYILKGLSSNLSCYTLASYIIISQLMKNVKLAPEIVNELLKRTFGSLKDDLRKEALELLLFMFQSQYIKSLPKEVLSKILSSSASVQILLHIVEDAKAYSLMKAIIKRIIIMMFNMSVNFKPKKKQEILKFLQEFLNNVKLDEKCVSVCFNMTLKKYLKRTQKTSKRCLLHSKNVVRQVFKSLECKFPDHFDKAYAKFIEKSKSRKKMLCSIINSSVCSVKYEVVPNEKISLALGLYHANPNIRETSIIHLKKVITKKIFFKSKFIENCIYDRLLDDNPKVVQAILSCADAFLKFVNIPKVISAFENIFTRPINLQSDWYNVQMKCLAIITKYFSMDVKIYDVLQIILNFIIPVNEDTVEGFVLILNSSIKEKFIRKLLKSMRLKFKDNEDIKSGHFSKVNRMVITVVEEFIDGMDEESKIMFSSLLKSKITTVKSNSLSILFIYVMQFMLKKKEGDCNSAYINNLLQIFKSYFSESNVILDLTDTLKVFRLYYSEPNMPLEEFKVFIREWFIKEYLHSLNKRQFPACLIYYTLFKIVADLKLNIDFKSCPSIENGYNNYKILNSIFEFCCLHLNSNKVLLKEFFQIMIFLINSCQLKSIQSAFCFFSTKWQSDTENLAVHLTSVSVATMLITQKTCMDWLFQSPMIFFSVIRLVGDPSHELRYNALCLLSRCLESATDCVYPLKSLGNVVSTKSEEIKTDYRQCFECVGKWLKAADDKVTKPKCVSSELEGKISVLNQILGFLNQDEVCYTMKYFLLSCLQSINSVNILSAYIPVLYSHLALFEKMNACDEYIFKIIHLLVEKFTPSTAIYLTENSAESKALLHCLNLVINRENNTDRRVQTLVLDVLSKEFFSNVASNAVQQEILESLLVSYMTSPANISTKIEKALRQLCSYAYLFFRLLQDKVVSSSKNTTLREVKKLKVTKNNSCSLNAFESDIWKKVTVFLELMQNESELLHKEILIPELFNLLNRSLDFDSQARVEYIKQLILSAIYSACEQFHCQQELEQYFRVELIVQCIRTSSNPKTHRQALLLLNLAAAIFPDYVLKNVMSIFVFMGSSLVRQDDSYSFQVISQTIETIVPSLREASHQQKGTDGENVVASVIRVFVDSLLDIPGHRQLPLFTKLITTLDPSEYLWIPLGQICDQYAAIFHDIAADNRENWKINPSLEFAVNLHKQFSPDVQIDTCIKLVDFLHVLPDTKKQIDSNPKRYKKFKEPFNIAGRNDNQLQIYKHNVLSYIKIWLSSQAFLSQVSELSMKEHSLLELKYVQLLESVLSFLQDRLIVKKQSTDSKKINDQIQLLYDLVYAINSILPCNLFIRVMQGLLRNGDQEIQLRAVELLNTKLEEEREMFIENHESLVKLMKPLLKLADACLNEENKDDKLAIIQQNALFTLHLLIKLIGSKYPTKFYKVLRVSVSIVNAYNQPELIVNALLCLAQLCHCLNVQILPRLDMFMPVILKVLKKENVSEMGDSLILGIVTALQSIIENLGIFLSKYMEDIISSICTFSVKYSKSGKKTVAESFENLHIKLANEIPLRVLLFAIESSYLKLFPKNANTVVPLMNMLTQNLNSSKHEDILSCVVQLQKFYLSLLDFRNCNQHLPSETINLVENSIISSLQTFVMKLSVSWFRTFFQKLYQWAMVTNDDQEQKYRIFSFYKVTCEFSQSLKSLFSIMSKYFFTHTSTILDSCNVSKSNMHYFDSDVKLSQELLYNILDTLKFCFMHSEEQLLDKGNFELLMHPLINQIENLDDEETYQDLIENHLNNCIAYFMSAVSDSALWKALNYQVLLRTRHDSPKVRFGALQVILEVVKKMGDNYLVLLPESIPFLAEIMEDESAEVEQECQTVIIEMEKILGEPIRKYF